MESKDVSGGGKTVKIGTKVYFWRYSCYLWDSIQKEAEGMQEVRQKLHNQRKEGGILANEE